MSLRAVVAALVAALLVACASQPEVSYPAPPPEYAREPRDDTAFAALESGIRAAHGDAASGFMLLDRNEDGLRWRLALMDSARHTIDAQYYLWYGDIGGQLMALRLLEAAERGVKVRLLLDDLNTLLGSATSVKVRDDLALLLDAHPNVELRVFNPWSRRSLGGRAVESVSALGRVNQRMHNKALTVDNQATIFGGRNIGDEYLGLNPAFNFHDLDVLGIGPVARQVSGAFDLYWNSAWTMPVSALGTAQPEAVAGLRAQLAKQLEAEPVLQGIPVAPEDWTVRLAGLSAVLHPGASRVATDLPEPGEVRRQMLDSVNELTEGARQELLVLNAYLIPDDAVIARLERLRDAGVRMRVVTNSLASHDVPAVNSHYKRWRRPLLQAGVDLYEIRHDAAIQTQVADTPPVRAQFMGLHAKGLSVDGERVWIGSMNFDPRSAGINTEMGVTVESRGLAGDFARLVERDAQPANSWRVSEDEAGALTWTHDGETVQRQPARSWWQRVQDVVFMAFPKELY